MSKSESETLKYPSIERIEMGRALREKTPRQAHADYWLSPHGRDSVEILEESNRGRVPDLVPIRYGRMLRDAFAFLRGSAALMAHDLAATPVSGIRVQACGDCHLANSDDPLLAMISGYLGKSDLFAQAYADQTEQDYQSLVKAAKSGRVQAVSDL